MKPKAIWRILVRNGLLGLIGLLLLITALNMMLHDGTTGHPMIRIMYGIIGLGGVIMLIMAASILYPLLGKTVYTGVFEIAVPGEAELDIVSPSQVFHGNIILLFDRTPDRYNGKVAIKKQQNGKQIEISSVLLPVIKPSFVFSTPQWLRWAGVSDTGKKQECWPRGTGRSFYPIIIPLGNRLCQGEIINIQFRLNSNFQGTNLEATHPSSELERVSVCIKGKS